jgi:prophage antirepressor-like protein
MTKLARHLFGNEDAVQITNRNIDGERWYMALIICQILGMSNHSIAVHRDRERDTYTLEDDEWRKDTIFTGNANRQVLLVNTTGMLKIIFQGRTPRAREVQERARKTPANLRTSELVEWPTWISDSNSEPVRVVDAA